MKLGIEIVCRYNSSRFKGKILHQINNKSVLLNIFNRIKRHLPDYEICVATSKNKTDDLIYEECILHGINIFRGDLLDVSGRLLACAKKFNWDYFVRINGDNIFVDVESLNEMINLTLEKRPNFITNVPSRTFPYGMSVEIIRTKFYENLYKTKRFSSSDKEHVTKWLYENLKSNEYLEYKNLDYKYIKRKKLALDSKEDLDLIENILNSSGKGVSNIFLKDIDSFFKANKF